jgi:radical SAM superfamily enzyme YgiQ (UPF0313 family)
VFIGFWHTGQDLIQTGISEEEPTVNEKSVKILLFTPPEGLKDGNVKKPFFGVQPLGIFYIESYLKKFSPIDLNVKICDAYTLGAAEGEIESVIREFSPDIVGVSAVTILLYDAQKVCSIAKNINRSIVTVLGGPHVTSDPFSIAHPDVDYGVSGEGEETFLKLVGSIADKDGLHDIKGIIRKTDANIVFNGSREPIEVLDDMPFPDADLLTDEIYNPLPTWGTKGKFCAMVTSRGCPYNCSYCSVTKTQGQKYRYRSAENMLAEIERLYSEKGIRELSFRDGTFTTVKARVYELCEGLLRKNIKVRWTCNTRANEIDDKLLDRMAKCGCAGIFLGIEHGNKDLMWRHKRLKKDDVTAKIKLARRAGLDVQGYFMLGMPDERKEDILETIDYANSLDLNTAAFTIATPYPGTRLYAECEERDLLVHRDWSKYDARLGLTWRHPTISEQEMSGLMKRCYRRFYLRPRVILERIKRLKNPKQIKDYFILANQFLK